MAQAITFIIMAYPPTHTADDDNGKYKRGDIIDAALTVNVPEAPHVNSRFVFIDVDDVPNQIAVKIRDIRVSDDVNIYRRKWYLERDLIPAGRLASLIANRRGSATWAEFKTIVRTRFDDTNITDGDFA